MAAVAFRPVTEAVDGFSSRSFDRRYAYQGRSGRSRSRKSNDRSSIRLGAPRLEVNSDKEQQGALKVKASHMSTSFSMIGTDFLRSSWIAPCSC